MHRTSSALAHDLNNLLSVILGANERLVAELPEGGDQRQLALLGLEAAERGAGLLRRTLRLAHKGAAESDAIDCADALHALHRLARQTLKPGVGLRIAAPAAPLICTGDRTDLEMALLNLCLNAGHATADGGEVSVDARPVRLGVVEARRLRIASGAYVAFTVRDTGKGMSAEVLALATQPLFTTKSAGSGLGLSSVIDFASSARGAFSLRSVEGRGTTATLYLPCATTVETASAA